MGTYLYSVPLDPAEGAWYTERKRDDYDDEEIVHIYKLAMWDEDWINPTVDREIIWEKDSLFQSDSDEELENYQNQLHNVFTL